MTDKTDSKELDLMALVDAYAEARHVGGCQTYNAKTAEARNAVIAKLAESAGSEPVAPAGAAVLCWVNEDELPEGLTQEAYSALFPHSKVDGVRMFPIFGPTAQAAPAGAGTWAHLKLMMEESAWDGTLQLSDALANIDDFAAVHPSPPEGMVGGWMPIETAPKDGTYLLLWEQYSTNPFVGCWAFGSWSVSHEHVDAEGGWDGANVVDSISQDRITHWTPLPLPPTSSADSRKGE